jgi:hypothetical protein
MGIDIESLVPDKTEKCHPEFSGGFDCETRWGTHRGHYWNSRNDCFLYQFEARTTAKRENRSGKRRFFGQKKSPDQFIDRIVSPNILSKREERSISIEKSRRMKPASGLEDVLTHAQGIRERMNGIGIYLECIR